MTQTKSELLQTRHQGDIRLGDADSTHYVGFKAPATVGTSLVWTLPAADGSANQILKTDGSGTLSWATDSATDSTKMPLAGGTFTGDVIFTGDAANVTWDKSTDDLIFNDSARAIFGTSSDGLEIFHESDNSYISDSGTGGLVLLSNGTLIETKFGAEHAIKCTKDGSVELYYDNFRSFLTNSNGIIVYAPEGSNADIHLYADEGDDNADKWRIRSSVSGTFIVGNYSTGSWVDNLIINGSGNVGIGDSSPGNLLTVAGRTETRSITGHEGTNTDLQIASGHASSIISFSIGQYGVSASEKLRIGTSGEIGIGGATYGSSGQVLTSGGSGAAVSWTTVSGGVSSDAARNTVGGTNAGDSIASGGEDNTCFGYDAGTAITTNDEVTAIGAYAAPAYTGSSAVFVGFKAGYLSTSANQSTVVGSYADSANETGGQNVMIGRSAGGSSGTNHSWNTVVGYASGSTITGSHSVFVGRNAGQYQTSGGWGVFLGAAAGPGTSIHPGTGHHNIGIGTQALHAQGGAGLSGDKNVMVGTYGGYNISTGAKNSSLGHQAGMDLTTGDNNLLLGFDAGRSTSPAGSVTTGDNIVCLGDANIAALYCADTSISSSDSRDKADVTNFTHGLSWINKLNPITYRWDKRAWYDNNTPNGSKKRARQHIGFLAQDVLEIEKADGFGGTKDDMLVVNLNEDDTAYGLKYERFVPVLVNAIKELAAKVEVLEAK